MFRGQSSAEIPPAVAAFFRLRRLAELSQAIGLPVERIASMDATDVDELLTVMDAWFAWRTSLESEGTTTPAGR